MNKSELVFENPDGFSFFETFPFVALNKLFFVPVRNDIGMELHYSDGTSDGTELYVEVELINGVQYFRNDIYYLAGNEFGFFFSSDWTKYREIYYTSGTGSSTIKLTDFLVSTKHASELGDNAVFLRNNAIYQSNGTKEGTIVTGNFEHTLKNFSAETLGDQVFFSLESPNEGEELWVTDGTTEGTRLLKDIIPGSGSSYPSNPVVVDDLLFFVAGDSTNGFNIYYTDGSSENTVQFSDQFKYIRHLKVLDGNLYFIATDETNGEELWKADLSSTDTSRPTVNLFPNVVAYSDQSPVKISITTSEDITGLEASDFKVINGRAENLEGSGSLYAIDIYPEYDSLVYLELPSNVAINAAGNGNQKKYTYFRYDASNPSVDISVTEGDSTNISPLNLQFMFSEEIVDFDSSALQIDGGTISSFVKEDTSYYVVIQPTITSGFIQILVHRDYVVDKVGKSLISDLTDSIYYDIEKPYVISVRDSIINTDTFSIQFIPSEPIIGVDTNSLWSYRRSYFEYIKFEELSDGSYLYHLKIKPEYFNDSYDNLMYLPSNGIYDLVGNKLISSDYYNPVIDITKPTIDFISETTISQSPSVKLEISFNEFPIGFEMENLVIENGTISNFEGDSLTYSFTLTAISEGDVKISVSDSTFRDFVGNYNEHTEFIYSYDLSPPTTIIKTPGFSNKFIEDSIVIELNEPVLLIDSTKITVTNAEYISLDSLSPNQYQLKISPLEEGEVSVTVAPGVFQDFAGNLSDVNTDTSYVYDITAPYLLNDSSIFSSNANPINVQLQFSEPVIGLSDSSFSFDNLNYTISGFSSVDSSCTFNVSLDEAGFLEMSFITGIITDRAGNELIHLIGTILLDDVAPGDFTIQFEQGQYVLRDGVTVSFLIENPELNSIYEYKLGTNKIFSIQGTDTIRAIENEQFVIEDIQVENLNAGQLDLELTLTDSLGNVSEVKVATSELIVILGSKNQKLVTAYTENQSLYLKFSDHTFANAVIRISDLSGKELIRFENNGSNEQAIKIPNSGVYLVQLIADKRQEAFKILIK